MCGRYTLYTIDKLDERFRVPAEQVAQLKETLQARYNIGPSGLEPTVTAENGKRRLETMRWGYMPAWAKDAKDVFKYKTFNARSEEIFDKPTWKRAIRHSRCLVPSNGFYEWQATPSGKQPYFVRPKDQELFAFAGVYGRWKDAEGLEWGTYSILTTVPNREMAGIHNRMPVIVRPEDEGRWLEPANESPDGIADILRPYEDGMLEIYPVSPEVNTTRVDDETLVRPLNSQ